jgi:outer membrane protein assembly factor BamB
MRLLPLLAATMIAPALLAQSPMFRGNPAHTGVYTAPNRPLEGKVAWAFESLNYDTYKTLADMDGGFMAPTTPAVVGDRIYFCTGPFFFALDASGKQLYRIKLPGRTLASPAVVDGVAFVPADDGKLHALEAATGATKWTTAIGAPTLLRQVDNWDVYQSSAAVADGVVYVGSTDGRIYAIDAKTGAERWHFQTKHVVRATPAIADGRVFCGSWDGFVYALDAATGRLAWQVDTRIDGVPWNSVQGSCAVANGVVYVGSRSTFTFALAAGTGKVLWKHSHDGGWVPSSPAVRDGICYVGQSDGSKAVAIDASGNRLWAYSPSNETFASPAIAGDVVYIAGNDNYNLGGKGSLSAVDIKTGKALWRLELPGSVWSSPVVAGDRVYVGCADGKVYAVK